MTKDLTSSYPSAGLRLQYPGFCRIHYQLPSSLSYRGRPAPELGSPLVLPSTHWPEWVFNNAICFVIFKLLKNCFYNQQITRMVWDCTDMKGTPFSSLLPPSPLRGARQFLSSEATTATSFLFLLLETRHACMSTGRHTSFVKITWHEASVTEVL